MKKVSAIFVLIFIFSSLQINAQTLIDTNKVWYNVEGNGAPEITSIFGFKGDTLIAGLYYKKVIISDSSSTIFNFPIAAREDTTTKKVFFYDGFQENLAYDFSLQLDSLFMSYNDGCVIQYLVTGIDSIILMNGEHRKRWTLHGSSQVEQWIEGIGSNLGIFRVGMDFCPIDSRISNLNCFKENDTLKYHNPNFASCLFVTGIGQLSKIDDIKIFPNPFTQSTQISLNQSYHNIILSVYDIQGKQVAQQQYADCDKIQLNRNGLGNGMYFLKLTLDDKAVETGKIIISE
jgi:hypothetical protein